MAHQRVFDFAFVGVIAQAEEVEQIRVFQSLARQFRVRDRQTGAEVGDSLPLAFVQAIADIKDCPAEEVEEAAENNAMELFRF